MGQYHVTVNLTKKQYLKPHTLGDGAKLLEQAGYNPGGTNDALHMLLAVSSGRGGGDFGQEDPLIGSWGGDRIAVVGDYAERSDLTEEDQAETIYGRCSADGDYEDITPRVRALMEIEYEVVYLRGDRLQLHKCFSGFAFTHANYGRDRRAARIAGVDYYVKDLLDEVRRRSETEKTPFATVESRPVSEDK